MVGREAEGHAVWRGATGAVKAILESDGITLRGEVRGKLPRAGLTGWRADGEDLCLHCGDEALVLTLGAKEASAWVRALDKPLPSLAEKLGLSASSAAWLTGGQPPAEIAAALAMAGAGAQAAGPQEAAMILAVLVGPDYLAQALADGQATGLRVWCVYGKGKGAAVSDAVVRTAFRGAGWMDIKTCAVSQSFTATLYRPAH